MIVRATSSQGREKEGRRALNERVLVAYDASYDAYSLTLYHTLTAGGKKLFKNNNCVISIYYDYYDTTSSSSELGRIII